MPEQLVASIPGQLRLPPSARRLTWSLACVLALCGMPAAAFAQGAPAALRACAAETDSAQRLACYDREMARLGAPAQAVQPAQPAPPVAAAPQPTLPSTSAPRQAPASAPAEASTAPAAPASSATPAQDSRPAAAKSADAGPAGGSAASWKAPWKIFSGGGAWRLTAHVASLDRWPDAMVLHLDNGQVWRQVGRASGDLGLKTGDSVTIEKHLGSYWLSSRHVSNMKVRLDSGSSASN